MKKKLSFFILITFSIITFAQSNSIERLNYTYEDFEEEQMSKISIPWMWTSLEDMVNFLSNIDYLKYSYGTMPEGSESISYSSIVQKIEANINDLRIVFTNLHIKDGDSLQFGQNYKDEMSESYNDFFPQSELEVYRITGVEPFTVKAGTFECTIVEGIRNEEKLKLWMINEKPGVYAKIIRERTSRFGDLEYHLMELEEVK